MEYFATGQYGHLELALFMEHVEGFEEINFQSSHSLAIP